MCQEVVERKEEVLNLKAQIAIYAFFEDTCNQKTAKVCNSFVPADNSLPKAKESENSMVNNYLCNDIGAPVSSSEYVALIIFAVLLIVGCAYLVWR